MPRDDQTFFTDLEAADEALHWAVVLSDPFDPFREWKEDQLARFGPYSRHFRELGRISGGTEPVIAAIKQRILPMLEKYEQDNNEGPSATIRVKLEGWRGPAGSAAYQFKTEYLPALATSMENQYSVMQSMAAAMITHEGIIDQARQKYLDIIDNTTAKIEETERQRERASSLAGRVVEVVSAIAAGMTVGAPAGGAGAAAFGALTGIGSLIDGASADPVGEDWFTITEDALGKLDELKSAVEEETHAVGSALDEVMVYVDGEFRHEFLAPAVDPAGSGAGGRVTP